MGIDLTAVSSSERRAPKAVPTEGSTRVSFLEFVLFAVPALWVSMRVVARNPVGIPHLERLLLVSGVIWVALLLVAQLLLMLRLDRKPVVYSVFAAGLIFVTGGPVVRRWGTRVAIGLLVLAAILMYFVVKRLVDSALPDVLVVLVAVGLISGPVFDAWRSVSAFGSSNVDLRPVDIGVDEMGLDVYVIVLDGFPGLRTLDMDFGEDVARRVGSGLRDSGFSVPESAWTSYPRTNLSVPSLLSMDYPAEAASDDPSSVQALYDIISGENPVRRYFSESGFDTWMLESGWSGSSCRSWYDHCIPSPWLDSPMYYVLRSTVLADVLVPETGQSYGVSSKHSMSWLLGHLPVLSRNDERDFVFGHVMAPHPPFFLNSDCTLQFQSDRAGFFFSRSGATTAERSRFLEGQIACVESFIQEVSSRIDPNQILIFVSDHGTDRRDQLSVHPAEWSEEAFLERMNAFLAARLPDACSLRDGIYLVNLFRHVLSCLSGSPIPNVEERTLLSTLES